MSWIVYRHVSPSGKCYVGITSKSLEQRCGKNGCRYSDSPYFWKAIQKYGWVNFKHEILYENLSEDEAKELEKHSILMYNSNCREYGYNLTGGGDGTLGIPCSKETRAKISKKLKGRKFTNEHKKHMSESRNHPKYRGGAVSTAIPVDMYSLEGDFLCTFWSLSCATKVIGVDSSGISRNLRGKSKTCGGYIFKHHNVK